MAYRSYGEVAFGVFEFLLHFIVGYLLNHILIDAQYADHIILDLVFRNALLFQRAFIGVAKPLLVRRNLRVGLLLGFLLRFIVRLPRQIFEGDLLLQDRLLEGVQFQILRLLRGQELHHLHIGVKFLLRNFAPLISSEYRAVVFGIVLAAAACREHG
ncbi:hypothetical protein D3C73_1150030 [compost metagenome]